jgi:putative ABC transport system substrate-binding protein
MKRGILRREFIFALGGAAVSTPFVAHAQQPKMAVLGLLASGNPNPGPFFDGLRDGLRELGYTEGQNFRLELRSARGNVALLGEMAAELVRMKVDVIVAFQTPAATAAKQASGDVPIVMAGVGDPVGTGLVQSLARPGGNVTGTSNAGAELVGKNIELLRSVLPAARRVAVMLNETDPFTKSFSEQIALAGRAAGMEIQPITVRQDQELGSAFAGMRENAVDAIIVQPSLLGNGSAVALALKERLPAFSINKLLPVSGGVASYSANFTDLYRQSAGYVDKILQGRKPADLPVALPTKFELVINLRTARALGLTIQPSLLALADEVIE